MSSPRVSTGLLALVLLVASPFPVNVAQAADAQLEQVIVKSPKNAAMMPYDDVYVRLKRMEESKLDRIRMQIKVTVKDESVKLADVRVAIVNDTTSLPVPLGADGSITVPVRPELYKTDAEIRSNQPKGALSASLSLAVAWSGGQEIPYSEVDETVRQLKTAGKDLLGWLGYMLFFPSMSNVEIPLQFPEPRGQTLRVVKEGKTLETYTADEKGMLKFKLKAGWTQLQPTLVFSEPPPKF